MALRKKMASGKSYSGKGPARKPPPPAISDQAMERFLKLTGFKREQVISSNFRSWVFVTDTGGKYQMKKPGGKSIRILSGPQPPVTSAVMKE